MDTKAGFDLVTPLDKGLTKKGTILKMCAVGGPLVVTAADIQATLIAQGLVSPNDATRPLTLVSAYGYNMPKGRITRDQVTDTDIVANGAMATYTEAEGDTHNLLGGENAGAECCVVDENCDLVPDDVVDLATQWTIPEGGCMGWKLDYA